MISHTILAQFPSDQAKSKLKSKYLEHQIQSLQPKV